MTVWGTLARRALAGAALVVAAALGGCLAESEHPVAAADPAKNEPRLWGSWMSQEEDGYIIAHVFATDGHTLRIAVAEHGVEGLGEVESYDAHVTNLPFGDYLNVMVTGSEPGYLIGKYQFDGTDTVTVWFPGNAALVQAVRDGKLVGTTKPEGSDVDVRITATPEQWQAFLSKPPETFFDQPVTLTRIGPAYVEQQ